METDVVVKAVVFNPEGKLLLLRRSETDTRRPHQWDLPGGLKEEDEDCYGGLVREIKEESGLAVSRLKLFYSKTEISKWDDDSGKHEKNVVKMYFMANVEEKEIVLSFEHSEFTWVSLEQAVDYIVYPRHKEVLLYIKDNSLEL